jgi:D-sedoheptulose 7-phosphate isomerase
VLEETYSAVNEEHIEEAVRICVTALQADQPLLVCGNGGSASDAMHITGELVGRFLKERRAINAICLSSNAAILTAWANDYSFEDVFARQVEAHGRKGGVLIALSTSGNSGNVIQAAQKARDMGLSVISLTGEGGGKLAPLSDVVLAAPSRSTPHIQQVHICIYHHLCAQIEAHLAGH